MSRSCSKDKETLEPVVFFVDFRLGLIFESGQGVKADWSRYFRWECLIVICLQSRSSVFGDLEGIFSRQVDGFSGVAVKAATPSVGCSFWPSMHHLATICGRQESSSDLSLI